MTQYTFDRWQYDSVVDRNMQTTVQVGQLDLTLTAYYNAVSVPFDFSISASPSTQPVTQGNSTAFAVGTQLIAGASESVQLVVVSGLPTGATASFSPQSGFPPFTSVLTIQTSPSTPVGTYPITIGGMGSVDRSTSVTLQVNEKPIDKGTIMVSAMIGSISIANATGEIKDSAGNTVDSFTSTPHSWDQAVVGQTYTITVRVEGYAEKTDTAQVTTAGQSVQKTFQFVLEAGFPLWVVVAAGGTLVLGYFLTRGGSRRK